MTVERADSGTTAGPARCVRHGNRWLVVMGGRAALVRHCRGMLHLAVLMANPRQEVAADELARGLGIDAPPPAATQRLLDPQAVRDYRRRVEDLRRELDRADARGDRTAAVRAHAELDWILGELRAATGLGGRPRAFTRHDELARVAVGKAIRRAIRYVTETDEKLGWLLASSVQTGRLCVFHPITAPDLQGC